MCPIFQVKMLIAGDVLVVKKSLMDSMVIREKILPQICSY